MSRARQTTFSALATLLTAGLAFCLSLALFPGPVENRGNLQSLSEAPGGTDPRPVAEWSTATQLPSKSPSQRQKPHSDQKPGSGEQVLISPPSRNRSLQTTTPGGLRELSAEEMAVFASLPPMCTQDLPLVNPKSIPTGTATQPAQVEQSSPAIAASTRDLPAEASLAEQTLASNTPPETSIQAADHSVSITQQASFISSQPDDRGQSPTPLISPEHNSSELWDTSAIRKLAEPDAAAASQLASFNPHAGASHSTPTPGWELDDPHEAVYSRTPFPSATECAKCHQQIYEEWAASSHAYASISPMFHVFEDTISRLSQGTIGYFCYRCHAPVSTTMGLRRDQPIWDGPRVFREGVTCVACHRVRIPYGKVDGERRIEPGDVHAPVYGAGDGQGVTIAAKYRDFFKIKIDGSDRKNPGQPMHRRAIQFEELSKSTFCMSCHQVAVEPGIKLEVVWDQYRASPAYREGISCQDCHMGRIPGVDEGYSVGPGAVVNGKVINGEKKHANHVFYGPGYSIAHPGIFPDNVKADRWSVNQWLEFDWRAGWGTDAFEDALANGRIQTTFPKTWMEVDDRYDAREIVDANLNKLKYKRDLRRQVLENGSQLDGPFFTDRPALGRPLRFRYCVTNLNSGHNMPSGSLGAQPQIWLNAVLIGPRGNRIWETGYLDSHGDLADNHSLDVLARKVPLDTQLVNFQTKFLTTNVKGTDREMYLPVNFDVDQIPFLRPPQQPVSVLNHPPLIRMESHSIPPLGKRNAKFSVPARLIQEPGTYRLSVRMRSRAEPIYFMRFCGATPEMQRMMNEWICNFHISTVSFDVR